MNCTYFSSETWDDRRWEAASEWPLPFFLVAGVPIDERKPVADEVRNRLDVDPITTDVTVGDIWPVEDAVAGVTREDVLAAWDAREETPDPPPSCPHDATEDSRCVFHGDADPEDVRAEFHRVIESDDMRKRYLSGATLPSLDLQYERIDAPDQYPIRLNYAEIDGIDLRNATIGQGLNLRYAHVDESAEFHNVTFEYHVGMRGARFDCDVFADEMTVADTFRAPDLVVDGDFSATRATFQRQVNLPDAEVDGTLHFGRALFRDVANFESLSCEVFDAQGATFEDVASFKQLQATELALSGGEFSDCLLFQDASVGEIVEFVEAVFRDRAFFTNLDAENAVFAGASVGHRLNLDGATVAGQISFGSADVTELQIESAEAETLSLMDATVRDGRIEIPADSDLVCDLTRATLGNVTFTGPPRRFESVLFSKTRFDGFNFDTDPHREALEAVDWNIHESAASVAAPGRTFEVTYARAKEGAKTMGDMVAASRFFVRQMRQRRRVHKQDTLRPSPESGLRSAAAVRYVSNLSLDLTTVYGERPRRVVGVTLAVLGGFAAVYPITRGIERGGEAITYSTNGTAAFLDSLYLSIITFTTIRSDTITLGNSLARWLTGVESFLGAFLMALLVFVFGRTIRV
jgi:uncharacterized protein YjbI with pentapeptide repeats